MTLHWSAKFVGIPFADRGRRRDGADCWGLACVVYDEDLGIVLPHYEGAYVSTAEKAEVGALIARVTATPTWEPVAAHEPYDVCIFRHGAMGSHIGIVVDRGRMLHVPRGGSARIEDYCGPKWASRLAAVYRHERLRSLQA